MFEGKGIIVHSLTIPSAVDDGVLKAEFCISRSKYGPSKAEVALHVRMPGGRDVNQSATMALVEQPWPGERTVRVLEAGESEVELVVMSPVGEELFRSPAARVRVRPLLTARPGRTLYTWEDEGCLAVETPERMRGRELAVAAFHDGRPLTGEQAPEPGQRMLIPFPLDVLPNGSSEVECRLRADGEHVATARVALLKLPPKSNEVKIDNAGRGLIVDGLPFLPFGFYCVHPTGDLPEVEATQGFNLIAPYLDLPERGRRKAIGKVRDEMDRCAALGLKVHYDLRRVASQPPSKEKWEQLRAEVEAIRDHPALLCWYLCDEPAGQGIDPAILDEAYAFVKTLDPYHPITMVFCVPSKAHDYAKGLDIVMADPYPIPHSPVTKVSDVADGLLRAFEGRMPLWMVPQAFGGGEWWTREPTAREQRVMTYLALIHGATGIQYFIRRPPVGNPTSPSLWSECRRLALEAAELAPALLSHEPRPEVTWSPDAVHAAAWCDRGYITILAANTQNRPRTLCLTLQGSSYSGKAEVLFENRRIDVREGAAAEMIDAHGTRAYRVPIGPVPSEELALDRRNLVVNPSFEEAANVGTPDGCYVRVGADRGASLFVDPRVARHGRHSLRLTTPTEGAGLTLLPFPVTLKKGTLYRLSVWAKARVPGLLLEMSLEGLDARPRRVELTTAWKRHELVGAATADLARASIALQLISAGTAWLDLLQVVPAGEAG